MNNIVVSTNYEVLIKFEMDLKDGHPDDRCFKVLSYLPWIANSALYSTAINGNIIHIDVDGERIKTGYVSNKDGHFYEKKWYGSIIHDAILDRLCGLSCCHKKQG